MLKLYKCILLKKKNTIIFKKYFYKIKFKSHSRSFNGGKYN